MLREDAGWLGFQRPDPTNEARSQPGGACVGGFDGTRGDVRRRSGPGNRNAPRPTAGRVGRTGRARAGDGGWVFRASATHPRFANHFSPGSQATAQQATPITKRGPLVDLATGNPQPIRTKSPSNGPGSCSGGGAWSFAICFLANPARPAGLNCLQIYRRLEARGEIRGGRFISGVSGEQFALGETVRGLRQLRDQGPAGRNARPQRGRPVEFGGRADTSTRACRQPPRTACSIATAFRWRGGEAKPWNASRTRNSPRPTMQSLLQGPLGMYHASGTRFPEDKQGIAK